MKTLSPPIDLIRRSIEIFFKKENLTFFLKIYFPVFILNLLQALRVNNNIVGELEKGNLQYFSDKPVLIAFLVLIFVIGTVFYIWFSAVSLESVIRVVNSGTIEFKSTYRKGWGYALKLFFAGALVTLIVALGLILLIIPGIVFAVWLSLVQFGIADKSLGIIDSLKESKALISGRFWKVLGRMIVFGLFSVLVSILFSFIPYGMGMPISSLFGALFILPIYLLYKELKG